MTTTNTRTIGGEWMQNGHPDFIRDTEPTEFDARLAGIGWNGLGWNGTAWNGLGWNSSTWNGLGYTH